MTRVQVALEDDPQPVEGEPRLHVLDLLGVRGDQLGQAAGRHHRALTQHAARTDGTARRPARRIRRGPRIGSTPPSTCRSRSGARPARPGGGGGVGEQCVEADRHAGVMAPPRYSPASEMASKVVAVPRSTTMHGPAEQVVGTDGIGDAVGSDLLGVVVEDGHPALDPRLEHHRRDVEPPGTIWRRLAVTSGTEEVTAMPVTVVSMSRPSRSSSWVRSSACSSAVRSATVDRRQWWASPVGSFPSGARSRPAAR